MTENHGQNHKSDAEVIDILRKQVMETIKDRERAEGEHMKEMYAHKKTTGWLLTMIFFFIAASLVVMYGAAQYGRLYKDYQDAVVYSLPKRNVSETFATKVINQADSLFCGMLLQKKDTATLYVTGPNGHDFVILIVKTK